MEEILRLLKQKVNSDNNNDIKRRCQTIISKIKNRSRLTKDDVLYIDNILDEIRLSSQKKYEYKVKIYGEIYKYNTNPTLYAIMDISIKELMDKYFTKTDSDLKSVYDNFPQANKERLEREYKNNPDRIRLLLEYMKSEPLLDFIFNYASCFNNKVKLAKEQLFLSQLLVGSDVNSMKNIVAHCKKYNLNMEELLMLSGIYKVEKNNGSNRGTQPSNHSVGSSPSNKSNIKIQAKQNNFFKNWSVFEKIDPSLPQKILNTNPDLLSVKHDKVADNLSVMIILIKSGALYDYNSSLKKYKNKHYSDILMDMILDNPWLLKITNIRNRLALLEEYKIPINYVSTLSKDSLKDRVTGYIESGLLDYIRENSSRVEIDPKKFYYGMADESYGMFRTPDEMRSRLVVGPRGIRGGAEKYQPEVKVEHYGDYDNFVMPDLLKKFRSAIPEELVFYLDTRMNDYISYVDKFNTIKSKIVQVLDERYKKDEYIYNVYNVELANDVSQEKKYDSSNGITISRKKVIDLLYLLSEHYKENKKDFENISSVFGMSKVEVLLVNILTYSSNCSNYALKKIIHEVRTVVQIYGINSFEDLLSLSNEKLEEDGIKNNTKLL